MAIKRIQATFAQIVSFSNRIACFKQPYEIGGALQARYAPNKGVQLAIEHVSGSLHQVVHFDVTQLMLGSATVRYFVDEVKCHEVSATDELNFLISYAEDSV